MSALRCAWVSCRLFQFLPCRVIRKFKQLYLSGPDLPLQTYREERSTPTVISSTNNHRLACPSDPILAPLPHFLSLSRFHPPPSRHGRTAHKPTHKAVGCMTAAGFIIELYNIPPPRAARGSNEGRGQAIVLRSPTLDRNRPTLDTFGDCDDYF